MTRARIKGILCENKLNIGRNNFQRLQSAINLITLKLYKFLQLGEIIGNYLEFFGRTIYRSDTEV